MANADDVTGAHAAAAAGQRFARRHVAAVAVMLVVFAAVVVGRNHIRARWWAHRLRSAEGLEDQAYYIGGLVAVGDAAFGPLQSMCDDPRPAVAALAIPASQGLRPALRHAVLERLVSHPSLDVAYQAATARILASGASATADLSEVIEGATPTRAAAEIAAAARAPSSEVTCAIARALKDHTDALVRAQAAEALYAILYARQADRRAESPSASDARETQACDPLAPLVRALSDDGAFSGLLALEREIRDVTRAVAAGGRAVDSELEETPDADRRRTVSQVAADALGKLTGQAVPPRSDMNETAEAALIEQCRRWIAERESAVSAHP